MSTIKQTDSLQGPRSKVDEMRGAYAQDRFGIHWRLPSWRKFYNLLFQMIEKWHYRALLFLYLHDTPRLKPRRPFSIKSIVIEYKSFECRLNPSLSHLLRSVSGEVKELSLGSLSYKHMPFFMRLPTMQDENGHKWRQTVKFSYIQRHEHETCLQTIKSCIKLYRKKS